MAVIVKRPARSHKLLPSEVMDTRVSFFSFGLIEASVQFFDCLSMHAT